VQLLNVGALHKLAEEVVPAATHWRCGELLAQARLLRRARACQPAVLQASMHLVC
jgi:hypothetical protein